MKKILGIETVKVGSTLWFHKRTNIYGWGTVEITGEATRSWLYNETPYACRKINKKTLIEINGDGKGYGDRQYYASEEQVSGITYVNQNKYRLMREVEHCNSPEALKKIEAILVTYTPTKETE